MQKASLMWTGWVSGCLWDMLTQLPCVFQLGRGISQTWCQSPEVTGCAECHWLRSMGCPSSGPASGWAPVVGWLPWRGPWPLSGLQKELG